jgi:fibronectin type 3 domain-containing protein
MRDFNNAMVNMGFLNSSHYQDSVEFGTEVYNPGTGNLNITNDTCSITPAAPPTIPPAPTNLTATAPKHPAGQINLAWTQSTGSSLTNNKVYRSTTSGGPYSLVATITPATTYSNTGLTSGTTYYYVVTAVNSAGESANSNQASATSR